jgi:hypothetical protein
MLILGCVAAFLAAATGCSQIEKQADYGTMNGGIPQDFWISGFGSGRNAGP